MWRVAGVLVIAAGCGVPSRTASDAGTEADAPRVIIDAPAADAMYMYAIELDYYSDSPLALAYRNADGPWTPVDPGGGTGAATIIVNGKYEVAYACGTAAQHVTNIVRHVPHESANASIGCFAPATVAPPAVVNVSGRLAQPGTVSIGGIVQSSPTGPWSFSMKVPDPGFHEVYAWDAARIAWRFGVDLHAAATLPPLDLDSGKPFGTLSIALAGAEPDEQIERATAFVLGFDAAVVVSPGSDVLLLPPDLAPFIGDSTVTLRAVTPRTTRSIDFVLSATPPTALAFLPRLAELAFSPGGATWTTPLAGDLQYRATSDAASLSVTESRVWRSTAPVVAVDLSAMPGYDLAWLPPFADAQHDVSITSVDAYGTVFVTAARDYALAARRKILP